MWESDLMPRCSKCQKVNPSSATFCGFCGNQLEKESGALNFSYGIIFVGFMILIFGLTSFQGAQSTENMYQGTILEDDQSTNQILDNAKTQAVFEIGCGGLILLVGAIVLKTNEKKF